MPVSSLEYLRRADFTFTRQLGSVWKDDPRDVPELHHQVRADILARLVIIIKTEQRFTDRHRRRMRTDYILKGQQFPPISASRQFRRGRQRIAINLHMVTAG